MTDLRDEIRDAIADEFARWAIPDLADDIDRATAVLLVMAEEQFWAGYKEGVKDGSSHDCPVPAPAFEQWENEGGQ